MPPKQLPAKQPDEAASMHPNPSGPTAWLVFSLGGKRTISVIGSVADECCCRSRGSKGANLDYPLRPNAIDCAETAKSTSGPLLMPHRQAKLTWISETKNLFLTSIIAGRGRVRLGAPN